MKPERKNEIRAVILFALSLFLFLSLFTFSEQDHRFYTSDPNLYSRNATGLLGSYIGLTLRFLVGKGAYVIPILVLVWGISSLLQIESKRLYFKIAGTLILIVAISSSLCMLSVLNRSGSFEQGGMVGTVVSGFLLKYLGKGGAGVFIIAIIVLSLLIATEFLLLPMIAALWKLTKRFSQEAGSFLAERSKKGLKLSFAGRKQKNERVDIVRKLEEMHKQAENVRKTRLVIKKEEQAPEKRPPSEPKIVMPKVRKAEPRFVNEQPPVPLAQGEYQLPPVSLLKAAPKINAKEREEDLKNTAAILEKTLLDFGVEAKVVKINQGPVITMYELEPAIGTKVNKITSLSDNISLAIKSANIRIVAPLPGKGTIGIEVPNAISELVMLRDVIESEEYHEESSLLKMALGKNLFGVPIITDLAKMPHLLIAGATGSGKTVCINTMISSLLCNAKPDELRFMMIDPKRVELMMFEGIPHLASPIVTSPKKAAAALGWVVAEMDRRYNIFASKGVRNIAAYREQFNGKEGEEKLPYIIVIVDELADLMMVAHQDVEGAKMRIAQLSRAAGIHMVLATQRPSVNVVTGVIKANFPARISFKVASKVDSRTVLDANGAEKLLGRGDMLLMEPGETALIRGQCSLVSDSEIKNLVKFIKSQGEPQYIEDAVAKQDHKALGVEQEKDDLYREAVRIVVATKQASVSMIQRKLRVGYTRAARMIDIMEEEGIVGAYNGSKPREILVESVDEAKG